MFPNSLFLTGIEIFAEISDEVQREMSLVVGSELVEDKPVRGTAVFHHGAIKDRRYSPSRLLLFPSPDTGCLTAAVAPGAQHDGASSEGRNHYRGQPSHQLEARQGQEREEPEPQDKVDLLIDDVEREDAETVELLLPCSGAH